MALQTYPAFYQPASGKSAGRPLPADGVSGAGGGKTAWRVGESGERVGAAFSAVVMAVCCFLYYFLPASS